MADRQAFDHLYARTFSQVYAYVKRRCDNSADAEDVVSHTFVVAWRKLDEVLAAEAELAWLYRVARGHLGNVHRSKKRRLRLVSRAQSAVVAQEEVSAEQHAVAGTEVDRVHRALRMLSEHDAEIIRLAAFEELSNAEIEAVLGLIAGTGRSQLYRARERLKAQLRDGGPYPDTKTRHGRKDRSAKFDPPNSPRGEKP
ncbi:MAG: sigma-70 family RNA polymerase sigma factor [Acidimicrobiales bacterium]